MQQAYGYSGSTIPGYSGAYNMAAGYGGPAGGVPSGTLGPQGASVRGGPVSQVSVSRNLRVAFFSCAVKTNVVNSE
jgi:hypothetical protein